MQDIVAKLRPDVIVRGPLFPEPVQVIVVIPMGDSVKLVGKGLSSGQVHEPILSLAQLAQLETSPEKEPFDGDSLRFRLGVEALRLSLAYEYDPYFSLSIARVDPLPHQLEAVYDYFLKLPRIRFLLADDPGAGKTIMAGLLLKELKIRGLVKRTLIVTPANLSFQWQREMKDKFRENFEVIRSDVLRANYGSNPWQEKSQVITSVSWVSRVEDAKESLLRSRWDLVEVFPANLLERLFRDMYARRIKGPDIEARIVHDIDANRFRAITESTLEGLAKRELNLSALIGRSAEARERRLVPEVVEDFFVQASPLASLYPKETRPHSHVYRVGRIPRTLWPIGERLEPRFGKLGREYRQIVFDKTLLLQETTAEWITPGHPLFETVREDVLMRVRDDLQRGSVFYDVHRKDPYRLDVFSTAIKDGRGNTLHRKLFVGETALDGTMTVRQPTIFLDLALAPTGIAVPDQDDLPDRHAVEQILVEHALTPLLADLTAERERETETISRHLEISLNELIHRQNLKLADLVEQQQRGETSPLLAANLKQAEDRIDELMGRLERRQEELQQERQCTIGEIQHIGRAWVLPHPERTTPGIATMVRDEEIERIAVETVIAHEQARGWQVESVEKDNRGFDLISRKPHPEDPKTAIGVRFIEVKGRAAVGEIALTSNEYKTAERLKQDYWLHVVFNCATTPEVHEIQDPARLKWEPVQKIEHYHVAADQILVASQL